MPESLYSDYQDLRCPAVAQDIFVVAESIYLNFLFEKLEVGYNFIYGRDTI
jgi:hypothetical protein